MDSPLFVLCVPAQMDQQGLGFLQVLQYIQENNLDVMEDPEQPAVFAYDAPTFLSLVTFVITSGLPFFAGRVF